MKNALLKILAYFASLAMVANSLSVNTTCTWHLHQPVIPEEIKELKRFK